MGLNDDELADLVTRWKTNQNIVNLWYETRTRVKKTIRENSVEKYGLMENSRVYKKRNFIY